MVKLLALADDSNVKAFLEMVVNNRLSVEIPPMMQFLPLNEGDYNTYINNSDLTIDGNYLINKKAILSLKRTIINEVEQLTTVKLSTLRGYIKDVPMAFKEHVEREIIDYLKGKGFYLKGDSLTKETLSAFELQAEALYKK